MRPVPDLDAMPVLASTCGVDLNPLDPTNIIDRQWLEALVWPKDRPTARLLHDALNLAASVPATVLCRDAVDVCTELNGPDVYLAASLASSFTAQRVCTSPLNAAKSSTRDR